MEGREQGWLSWQSGASDDASPGVALSTDPTQGPCGWQWHWRPGGGEAGAEPDTGSWHVGGTAGAG